MAVTFGGYCYDWVFDRDPENGSPRLRLEPATCTDTGIPTFGPGPAVVYATLDCCGEDYAIFSFGGEVLCPGTPPCPLTPPSQNVARYKVAWTPCAKWWCAYDADDETETCIPLYLTEDDICSGDYVTCSGPYDTYDAAELVCTPALGVACASCSGDTPASWSTPLSGFVSDCDVYNGSSAIFLQHVYDPCLYFLRFDLTHHGWVSIVSATQIDLSLEYGLTQKALYRISDWDGDCCSPVTLDLISTSCAAAPTSVTLTPSC